MVQDAQLNLVHIPLHHYQSYLQSILKLIFPVNQPNGNAEESIQSREAGTSWANQYPFLNLSVTPIECSIVCPKALAKELFTSPQGTVETSTTRTHGAVVSSEDFVVMSVEGEGLEAGKRVLELTSPLAMAGM